jgi:hypothetical protein
MIAENVGRSVGKLIEKGQSFFGLTGAILQTGAGLAVAGLGAGVLFDLIPHARLNEIDREDAWLCVAGGIGWAIFHFVKKLVPRWRARRRRFLLRHAGACLVLACAALLGLTGWYSITWAATPLGRHATFWRPNTLADCTSLVITVIGVFVVVGWCTATPYSPAQLPYARPEPHTDGSQNARYLALGWAMLAVVAFALLRCQIDLATVNSSLVEFFAMLPYR